MSLKEREVWLVEGKWGVFYCFGCVCVREAKGKVSWKEWCGVLSVQVTVNLRR